jgi:hypothetical protein
MAVILVATATGRPLASKISRVAFASEIDVRFHAELLGGVSDKRSPEDRELFVGFQTTEPLAGLPPNLIAPPMLSLGSTRHGRVCPPYQSVRVMRHCRNDTARARGMTRLAQRKHAKRQKLACSCYLRTSICTASPSCTSAGKAGIFMPLRIHLANLRLSELPIIAN